MQNMIGDIVWLLAVIICLVFGFEADSMPAQASSCPPAGATWSSSAQFGNTSWGNYRVNNDEWGAGYGSQTIWTSPSSFGVCNINQPVTSPNNVKAYPNAGINYPGQAWSAYNNLRGNFDMTQSVIPASANVQMLWDIWLRSLPNGIDPVEIGIVPWRHDVGSPWGKLLGTAKIYGVTYDVLDSTSPGGHRYYTFHARTEFKSGTVHILSALNWLAVHGVIDMSLTLRNISGGWEIWNAGSDLLLQMDNFSVTAN